MRCQSIAVPWKSWRRLMATTSRGSFESRVRVAQEPQSLPFVLCAQSDVGRQTESSGVNKTRQEERSSRFLSRYPPLLQRRCATSSVGATRCTGEYFLALRSKRITYKPFMQVIMKLPRLQPVREETIAGVMGRKDPFGFCQRSNTAPQKHPCTLSVLISSRLAPNESFAIFRDRSSGKTACGR